MPLKLNVELDIIIRYAAYYLSTNQKWFYLVVNEWIHNPDIKIDHKSSKNVLEPVYYKVFNI